MAGYSHHDLLNNLGRMSEEDIACAVWRSTHLHMPPNEMNEMNADPRTFRDALSAAGLRAIDLVISQDDTIILPNGLRIRAPVSEDMAEEFRAHQYAWMGF